MAQPSYAIQYLGSIVVEKGKSYTSAAIITAFPTATCLILTDIVSEKPELGIKVSINASPMFTTHIGEQSYLATGLSYVFDLDCVIAVGIYKAVA